MTELDLLFLVLALLYLWECSGWVRRGSVVFRTWAGRHWHLTHPSALLGNQGGGFVLAHPLPPLGTVVTANALPLSISAQGLLAFVAPSVNPGGRPVQSARFFRFDQIKKVEARGRTLRINDELFLHAASPTFASYLAGQLQKWLQSPEAKRQAVIEELLAESLSLRNTRARWAAFQNQTAGLRWITNILFAYLFVAAPLVIWNFGLRPSWLSLVLGLFALTLTTAILFHRAHKYFYPAAADDRFTHFLIILLAPASTIRARDALSRPLLEQFHPLTLARVFCREDEFRDCARSILSEIRHPALPLCPNPDPLAQQAERETRRLWQRLVENFLKQNGFTPDELLRPPTPADETCAAYCPRCLAQFTAGASVCPDCGGLPLLRFPAADKRS